MRIHESPGRKLFLVFNAIFIALLTLTCIIPIWNILCMSFSDASYVAAGEVKLWPVGFTTEAYRFVMMNDKFWAAFLVTLQRVGSGVLVNMVLVILAAYPLSKSVREFQARKYYVWFFIVTMLFNGGLIPTYIVVSRAGLINSIWALILPGAVPVFNVILLMNFFRSLPKEIEESANIDGAGQFTVMWRLYVPLSMPAIATIILFVLVGHWNSWFDGLIYMNDQNRYPLQSYLQTVITSTSISLLQTTDVQMLIDRFKVNDRNMRAAQIFIAMVPILAAYPFLQKYFTTGIVMGSVKG